MSQVTAFGGKILAEMIDRPQDYKKTKSGIFIQDKDGTSSGVRPRWFRIYDVGPDIDWAQKGQYVYVEHGRWTTGVNLDEETKVYMLDNKDCLLISDEEPDLTEY